MFEKIRNDILDTGANVFRIVMYRDGAFREEILRPSCPCLHCYSLSKNFTATAIGLAQDMGLLSVEQPIVSFFPDALPDAVDEKLARVKIRHLLSQTMGNGKGYLFEGDRFQNGSDDWVGMVLSAPLDHEPGEIFTYSNSTFYLLSCIIRRASGMTLELFLRNHLFRPMGIREYAWETCPKGETFGASGLYMSTMDIAKLGVLYLNEGEFDGKRILSSSWVRDAVTPHAVGADGTKYGYSFWMNDIGYHGGGAYNQVILVVPDRKLVFAAHSYGGDCDFIDILKKNLDSAV